MEEGVPPLHILVMTDRDWTHPQGGGTGANLYGQVSRWVGWGHRVSVIACSYPGAAPFERIADGLEMHRVGGRSTVFPRAILAQARGLVPDADVVLEVVNGITFLTPLWLRTPRVTLVHHVHRDHYIEEMGPRAGRVAAWLLETAPLKLLYRRSRFLTISHASARDIAELGIPLERIEVGYIGVELDAFGADESRRAPEPTLLYLGRLKRYKRVEVVLDALEACPGAVLELAGDGDHRELLEAEIERRGLGERVRMHGHVSEELKHDLYQRAWLNMTASSAEGWCLTVMEAAASGTPSAALAVGGLPESIVDGQTGVLAHDTRELAARTRELVDDPAARRRLGEAARARAQEFTWDATAAHTLEALEAERRAAREPRPRTLAAAVIAANLIALLFTAIFARLLGVAGYGSLAALVAAFLIFQVAASALQLTVAREGQGALAAVRRWLPRLLWLTVACAGVSALLREPIADLIGVPEAPWAAACALPAALGSIALAVERGALQGAQRYRLVGWSIVAEAGARLGVGLGLYAAGLGVTGAFLGTFVSVLLAAAWLAPPLVDLLRREPVAEPRRRIAALAGRGWVAVLALMLLGLLEYVDVIVVKHRAAPADAGAYAAASVAARMVLWVAIGLGLYLLPEAARRVRAGEDAGPLFARVLKLIVVLSLPLVALYALAAGPLLSALFGVHSSAAAHALPLLALAMGLQACAYLAVQYLLVLGRTRFLWLLGLAAVAEPLLLGGIGVRLPGIALALLGLQLVLAASVAAVAVAARRTVTPA
jgi:glycosyltransferase involved in cell wall biosynthesis/O-antigen/teichoic acid export membrane protein